MNIIDTLNRKQFVDRLINIVDVLSKSKKSCTFAINGEWGCGKSFVLDMFEKRIADYQDEDSAIDKYLVFHYNCWKYDYYEEPSIAIVSAMLDTAENYTNILSGENKEIWLTAKEIILDAAGELLKTKIGFNPVEIKNTLKQRHKNRIKEKNNYNKYFEFQVTLEKCRGLFNKIAKDRTLVIVVDELDRCLPEYAIRVLERLHHMFDGVENTVVILAVDKKQLEHTVECIFGQKTITNNYLKKFISFELSLDNGEINKSFINKYPEYFSLFDENLLDIKFSTEEIFKALFVGIDARNQDKIIEKAMLLHKLVFNEKPDYAVMCVELLWLVMLYHDAVIDFDKKITVSKAEGFREFTNLRNETQEFFKEIFDVHISYGYAPVSYGSADTYILNGKIGVPEMILWYFTMIYPNKVYAYSLMEGTPNLKDFKKRLESLKSFVKLSFLIV
ncbi:MAG: hypothetical protein J6B25_07535 [Clostridia bacterium]|nr:hypothetical protein [Clostridia bacterium]